MILFRDMSLNVQDSSILKLLDIFLQTSFEQIVSRIGNQFFYNKNIELSVILSN